MNLTIAIPVYNRLDYFSQALHSALSQTVPVEILVVDNASVHNDFERICKSMGPRVSYFRNPVNIGMFGNWNRCAFLAKTPWVLILGDDDIADPTLGQMMLEAVLGRPTVDIVYGRYSYLCENAVCAGDPPKAPTGSLTILHHKRNAIESGLSFPSVCAAFKRELLIQRPWRESPHGSNDWCHFYGLPNEIQTYGISKILMKYRKHAGSDTASLNTRLMCAVSQSYIYWQLTKEFQSVDLSLANKARERAVSLLLDYDRNFAINNCESLWGKTNDQNCYLDHLNYVKSVDSEVRIRMTPGITGAFLSVYFRFIRKLIKAIGLKNAHGSFAMAVMRPGKNDVNHA